MAHNTYKLKTTEVAQTRKEMLKAQRHVCPLCKKRIEWHEAALDHDHTSGHVRRVLHKQCNAVEGRVLHWTKRVGRTDPETFLRNLLKYWNIDYTKNPVHPNHGKPKRRRRRRKR